MEAKKVFNEIVKIVKVKENLVKREHEGIGKFAVDNWQFETINVQLMDEGYTTVVRANNVVVIDTYGRDIVFEKGNINSLNDLLNRVKKLMNSKLAKQYFEELKSRLSNDQCKTYEGDEFLIYEKNGVELTTYKNLDICEIECKNLNLSISMFEGSLNESKKDAERLKHALKTLDKCSYCQLGSSLSEHVGMKLKGKEMILEYSGSEDYFNEKVKIQYCPICGRKL